jgi:hypothetical protein
VGNITTVGVLWRPRGRGEHHIYGTPFYMGEMPLNLVLLKELVMVLLLVFGRIPGSLPILVKGHWSEILKQMLRQ